MLVFIIRRVLLLIPILLLVSFIAFFVIELPPGDWVTTYVAQLRASGVELSDAESQRLTNIYGFDQPTYVRYYKWVSGIVTRGDFGWSFQWGKPAGEVIAERLPITLTIFCSSASIEVLLSSPCSFSWMVFLSTAGVLRFADPLSAKKPVPLVLP